MPPSLPLATDADQVATIRDALILGLAEQDIDAVPGLDVDRLAAGIAAALDTARRTSAASAPTQAAREGRDVAALNASNDI